MLGGFLRAALTEAWSSKHNNQNKIHLGKLPIARLLEGSASNAIVKITLKKFLQHHYLIRMKSCIQLQNRTTVGATNPRAVPCFPAERCGDSEKDCHSASTFSGIFADLDGSEFRAMTASAYEPSTSIQDWKRIPDPFRQDKTTFLDGVLSTKIYK